MELTWQLAAPERWGYIEERARQDTHVVMEGGVAGIARELDRVAAGHGLTVSVPDSRQYVMLSRT